MAILFGFNWNETVYYLLQYKWKWLDSGINADVRFKAMNYKPAAIWAISDLKLSANGPFWLCLLGIFTQVTFEFIGIRVIISEY